jgi:hypothetical protein
MVVSDCASPVLFYTGPAGWGASNCYFARVPLERQKLLDAIIADGRAKETLRDLLLHNSTGITKTLPWKSEPVTELKSVSAITLQEYSPVRSCRLCRSRYAAIGNFGLFAVYGFAAEKSATHPHRDARWRRPSIASRPVRKLWLDNNIRLRTKQNSQQRSWSIRNRGRHLNRKKSRSVKSTFNFCRAPFSPDRRSWS